MGRALFDLMFGNPRRLGGTAIVLAIALMIFVRPAWRWLVNQGIEGVNWTAHAVITGLWDLIQIIGLIATVIWFMLSFRRGRGG